MENDGLTVDLFTPEDAKGVAGLFTEVYGDGYPVKMVYDPEGLIAAFEGRDNIPIVVRTAGGKVIGYASLFRVAPDKGVYEKGNAAVHPDFRNAGVMGLIFEYVGRMVGGIEGIKVLFGEPVCNYVYIQKAALSHLPFVETALEVDLMPAEAYDREESALGRVASLLMFITVVPRPQAIFVPRRFADSLGYVYAGLDDKRSLLVPEGTLPVGMPSKLSTQIFDFARVARIAVSDAGSDFPVVFASEEERLLRQNMEILQVWLKLSWPWVDKAAEVLTNRGYFLGGVLPQWFGDDALLMQKTVNRPNWEGINVFSERARRIVEFVRSDWERVTPKWT